MLETCGPCQIPCNYGNQWDQCTGYSGHEVDCFGILSYKDDKTQNLRDVIYKTAYGTCQYIKQNVVDISCLFDCPDGKLVPVNQGLQDVLSWACQLNTNDFSVKAPLFCLGTNVSPQGLILGTRGFTYEMTGEASRSTFTYNLENVASNLPEGITFNGVEILLEGVGVGNSRTIKAISSELSGGFEVTDDMFPAMVNIKAMYYTDSGEIRLEQQVGPLYGGTLPTQSSGFFVKDFSAAQTTNNISGTQYLTLLNGQVCSMKQFIEQLRYVQVTDCGVIKFPSKLVTSVIPVMAGWLCKHQDRLDDIGSEIINKQLCDDQCKERLVPIALQAWATEKDEEVCELKAKVVALDKRVVELEIAVKQLQAG